MREFALTGIRGMLERAVVYRSLSQQLMQQLRGQWQRMEPRYTKAMSMPSMGTPTGASGLKQSARDGSYSKALYDARHARRNHMSYLVITEKCDVHDDCYSAQVTDSS